MPVRQHEGAEFLFAVRRVGPQDSKLGAVWKTSKGTLSNISMPEPNFQENIIVLKKIVFLVGLIAALPAIASDGLVFPILGSQNLLIGKNVYKVGLYETNDRSLSGFVFSVHRDGFLITLGLIDGTSPLMISSKQYGWPNNVVAIQYGQGGHEQFIKYFALKAAEVIEIGTIGSNSSCIYQRPGENGLVEAIDEDKRKLTVTTYKVGGAKVRRIREVVLAPAQTVDVRKFCAEYNLK